jgi:hypothetical protein
MSTSGKDFEKAGIPNELEPDWKGQLDCFPSCKNCNSMKLKRSCIYYSRCITSSRERIRQLMVEQVQCGKIRFNRNTKTTLCILHYLWCVGNMHFRPYGMHMKPMLMSNTQAALMNSSLRQERLKIHTSNWCNIPSYIEIYVTQMFPDLTLSRDQAKLICNWVEDVFLALPMCVRKKMLMTSLALGFLIKRLVNHDDKRMIRMMFHAVFKQTLVRKKHPKLTCWDSTSDPNFLNAIFQK